MYLLIGKIENIDDDIQNKIYYSVITILCALLACCSLYTHKLDIEKLVYPLQVCFDKNITELKTSKADIKAFHGERVSLLIEKWTTCNDFILDEEKKTQKYITDIFRYEKMYDVCKPLYWKTDLLRGIIELKKIAISDARSISIEYIMLVLCMLFSVYLMLLNIISLELYSYIAFICIFTIFFLVYNDIDTLKQEVLLHVDGLLRCIFDGQSTRWWKYGLVIFSNFEFESYMYYLPLFSVFMGMLLCINYIYEFIQVDIDMCALIIFLFAIILNFDGCQCRLSLVFFAILFLYIFNFYDCLPLFKLLIVITVYLLIGLFLCNEKYLHSVMFNLLILIITVCILFYFQDEEFEGERGYANIFIFVCGLMFVLCFLYYRSNISFEVFSIYFSNILNEIYNNEINELHEILDRNKMILSRKIGNSKLPFYMFHNSNVVKKILLLICLSIISYTITLYFGVFPIISDALVLFAPCICLLMYSYIPGQQVFLSVFLFMINVFAILIDFKYTNVISLTSLLVMVIGIIYFHLYSPLHITTDKHMTVESL